MAQLLDIIDNTLREDQWQFERDDRHHLIDTGVRGRNGTYRVVFSAHDDESQVILYVLCPYIVPEEKRSPAAEYLTRANFGLRFGGFEMDMDDGESRYRIGIDIEGSALSPAMVRNMINYSVGLVDAYSPGLTIVCTTATSPREAILQVEGEGGGTSQA